MDYDTMPAGAEMDALVAKALGWHWLEISTTEKQFVPPDFDPHGYCMYCDEVLPSYSTDIAAAWMVNKPGWKWNFDEGDCVLYVRINNGPLTGVFWYETIGDKPAAYALARCRAFLKATEAEGVSA